MALRVNLYHEVLLARKQEQYDPLKLSVFGMIAVAACMVGYYFIEMAKTNAARSEAASAAAEFMDLEPKAAAARKRAEELSAEIELANRMTKRIEGRFYWAPVLEQLALAVPREIQIHKVTGEVIGRDPSRCQLTIEGIAASSEPRRMAEDLRTTLLKNLGVKYTAVTASFRNLDDGDESVVLDGNEYATAVFSMGVSFESAPEPDPKAAADNNGSQIAQKN